ncbi:MAG TPA: TfuA-like protein [Hyalangium sp.]|nr:TfuA-like protein [Hyalangium sp.]
MPQCTVLPPVAAGDLLRLPMAPGDTVALIDGFFRQTGAVRHKEILHLLGRGVHVLGASSMGALRAAELAPFGMIGVGEIFRMYASGEIDGDDEVALQHLSAEEGYRPISEALVTFRYNLRRARHSGVLSEPCHHALVELAKSLPFAQRVSHHMLSLAQKAGLPGDELAALREFLTHQRVDLKREDALALIALLPTYQAPPPRLPSPGMYRTIFVHQLQNSRMGWQIDKELFISDRAVLMLFQVAAPAYPDFHYHIYLRTLAAFHATAQGLVAPPSSELLAVFRARHALSELELSQWLAERHLQAGELAESLQQESLARQIVALRAGASPPEDLESAMLEPIVVDYLVHRGFLEGAEQLPEPLSHWTHLEERETFSPTQCLAKVAVRSFMLHPGVRWHTPVIHELKRRGAFGPALALARKVIYFNRLFRERYPQIVPERLALHRMTDWAAQRWSAPGDLDMAWLDRGFSSREEALESVRHFFLFDRQHPGELTASIPGPG